MRNLMCVIGALVLGLHSFAEEGEIFAKKKSEMLGHIDERISTLQNHKTCVSAAADKTALNACHDKFKEANMEFKNEMREQRGERKGDGNKFPGKGKMKGLSK